MTHVYCAGSGPLRDHHRFLFTSDRVPDAATRARLNRALAAFGGIAWPCWSGGAPACDEEVSEVFSGLAPEERRQLLDGMADCADAHFFDGEAGFYVFDLATHAALQPEGMELVRSRFTDEATGLVDCGHVALEIGPRWLEWSSAEGPEALVPLFERVVTCNCDTWPAEAAVAVVGLARAGRASRARDALGELERCAKDEAARAKLAEVRRWLDAPPVEPAAVRAWMREQGLVP